MRQGCKFWDLFVLKNINKKKNQYHSWGLKIAHWFNIDSEAHHNCATLENDRSGKLIIFILVKNRQNEWSTECPKVIFMVTLTHNVVAQFFISCAVNHFLTVPDMKNCIETERIRIVRYTAARQVGAPKRMMLVGLWKTPAGFYALCFRVSSKAEINFSSSNKCPDHAACLNRCRRARNKTATSAGI